MRYILLFLLVFFLILSKKNTKYKKVFIFFAASTLIVFASLRGNTLNGKYSGNDYISYNKWFNNIDNIKLSLMNDIGFNILMLVIKKITNSYQIFIIITSVLFVYSIFKFSIDNSKDYLISIFIFIAFGIFELGISAIRQWIAGSIFLLSFRYVKERKFRKISIRNIDSFFIS